MCRSVALGHAETVVILCAPAWRGRPIRWRWWRCLHVARNLGWVVTAASTASPQRARNASDMASIDDSFEEHALQEVGQPCLEPFDGPAGVVHEAQIRLWCEHPHRVGDRVLVAAKRTGLLRQRHRELA